MKDPKGGRYVYINFVYLRLVDLEDKEPRIYDPDDPDDPDFGPPPLPDDTISRHWMIVDDGGDAYWRAFLNLDKEKVEGIAVNGHA